MDLSRKLNLERYRHFLGSAYGICAQANEINDEIIL
jgi:hypothetical protein